MFEQEDWDLAQREATSEAAAASTGLGISPWTERAGTEPPTVLARVPPRPLEGLSAIPPSPGRALSPQVEDFILSSFTYPEVPKV